MSGQNETTLQSQWKEWSLQSGCLFILRSLQDKHCDLWWITTRNLKGKIFQFYKYQTVLQEPLQCRGKGLFLHCKECTGSQFTRTLEWDSLKTIWIKFSFTTQEIQASFLCFFSVTEFEKLRQIWAAHLMLREKSCKILYLVIGKILYPFLSQFAKAFTKKHS